MTGEPPMNLPNGWKLAVLCEVAELNPRLDKSAHTDNPMVSFVPMPGVEAGTGAIDVSQTRSLEEVKKGYTPFREGDVLFAKITPCMENGKMAVVPPLKNGLGFGSTEFHVLRPYCEISVQYIYFFVSSESFRRNAEHNMTGAVGQRRVPTSYLAAQSVPVPPAREQHCIVTKIKELFSELDKGVESLKTAQTQLKVYRQAVLKHAFEGKLTAQWREENKDKLEKPEQLLARIKQERAARYERQLEEWKTAVKEWEGSGSLDRKPSRPRAPSFPEPFTDTERIALPEISDLWRWAKVSELFSVYVGATPSRKNRSYWNGAINWITSGEVRFAPINKTNETVTLEGLANASTEIHPIGTVMLAMIGEGKTRGQAAVTQVEACHNQNTAAIRVSESEIPPEYVYYYLLYRYEDTRRVGSGNNQKALNKERVSNLPIPLPSLDEQAVVVEELKKLLSIIEQSDREIGNQLASASSLRQSILTKAFSGQLVAQDPYDEPASVLLDRIRAEREKAAKNNHAKKTKKRETTA